jgi:hypothetical protein
MENNNFEKLNKWTGIANKKQLRSFVLAKYGSYKESNGMGLYSLEQEDILFRFDSKYNLKWVRRIA